MTQAEKLEALVQKAIQNEWMAWGIYPTLHIVHDNLDVELRYDDYEQSFQFETYPAQAVIFDHEFAKALWGDGYELQPEEFDFPGEYEVRSDGTREYMTVHDQHVWDSKSSGWQYHLQQAVISDNPVEYVYKAVFGDE